MCHFFSCVSNGLKVMHFDAEMRRKIIAGETEYQCTDSHTSIAHHYGYKGRQEDRLNKYEYNPLTGEFKIDQINTVNDSVAVKRFCRELDWSTVVPSLLIKDTVNPLSTQAGDVTEEILHLLDEWIVVCPSVFPSVWDSVSSSVGRSVWDSVESSVWDSVLSSVGRSVGRSVWDSVRGSVWDSVWDSVRISVWDSVWDRVESSVWDSVWDSVRISVWAYFGSFFTLDDWKYIEHERGVYPFQAAVDLWERGFVPSNSGIAWRLHAGPKAEIVYERKNE